MSQAATLIATPVAAFSDWFCRGVTTGLESHPDMQRWVPVIGANASSSGR